MFEKPQKAQVVRIKFEAVSLHSASMVPSLDGPLLGRLPPVTPRARSNTTTNGSNASNLTKYSAAAGTRRFGYIVMSDPKTSEMVGRRITSSGPVAQIMRIDGLWSPGCGGDWTGLCLN